MKTRRIVFFVALSVGAHMAGAQEIGGKAVNTVDMKNSLILAGTSDFAGGTGSTIQSIVVEGKGRIAGDAILNIKMKNSLILTNGGSTIQSIAVRK